MLLKGFRVYLVNCWNSFFGCLTGPLVRDRQVRLSEKDFSWRAGRKRWLAERGSFVGLRPVQRHPTAERHTVSTLYLFVTVHIYLFLFLYRPSSVSPSCFSWLSSSSSSSSSSSLLCDYSILSLRKLCNRKIYSRGKYRKGVVRNESFSI